MNNSIYPCLWFDGQAKEAADFYCSVFRNARITVDTPMVVNFLLDGHKFTALNGGPHFKINPAISFFVVCETEEELHVAWEKLNEDGAILMPLDKYDWSEKYGWVQDKFGVSWQLALGKLSDVGQKFTPSLLFTGRYHGKAEAALQFYTSVFKSSAITGVLKYEAGEDEAEGTVKHAQFTINNYVIMAMDSALDHKFEFNEAVSLVVNCETQQEIDHYWNKLTEGGREDRCGWLKDQFGVSWQIVPAVLGELMTDPQRSQRVMQAFMKMSKFDIDTLLKA